MVWPLPLSLATTYGITIVLFSSSYLDVSVQRVRDYCLPDFIGMGCPIRTSADQRSFAPSRSFSQLTTSFVASGSQGILHTPLFRFHLFTMSVLQHNIALLLQSISSSALLGSVFYYTLFLLLLCPVLSMNFLHALPRFHSQPWLWLRHTLRTPVTAINIGVEPIRCAFAHRAPNGHYLLYPHLPSLPTPSIHLFGGGYRIRTDDP
jgi:hypothetical protein